MYNSSTQSISNLIYVCIILVHANLGDEAAVSVACAEQVLAGARADQRDGQAEPIVELQLLPFVSDYQPIALSIVVVAEG